MRSANAQCAAHQHRRNSSQPTRRRPTRHPQQDHSPQKRGCPRARDFPSTLCIQRRLRGRARWSRKLRSSPNPANRNRSSILRAETAAGPSVSPGSLISASAVGRKFPVTPTASTIGAWHSNRRSRAIRRQPPCHPLPPRPPRSPHYDEVDFRKASHITTPVTGGLNEHTRTRQSSVAPCRRWCLGGRWLHLAHRF